MRRYGDQPIRWHFTSQSGNPPPSAPPSWKFHACPVVPSSHSYCVLYRVYFTNFRSASFSTIVNPSQFKYSFSGTTLPKLRLREHVRNTEFRTDISNHTYLGRCQEQVIFGRATNRLVGPTKECDCDKESQHRQQTNAQSQQKPRLRT